MGERRSHPAADRRSVRNVLLVLFLSSFFIGSAKAGAQPEPRSAAVANKVVTRWDRVLRAADELLVSPSRDAEKERNAARKARRKLSTVFADCLTIGLSGEAVERRLALAFVLDGIAARFLGEDHEADWSRYSALALWPGSAEWDLSAYGAAAHFEHDVERQEDRERLDHALANPVDKDDLEGGMPFRLPKPKAKPIPKIRAPRPTTHSGQLIVRFHITAAGLPSAPRVMESEVPSTYLAAALRTYADWRFEPNDGAEFGLLTVQSMRIRW